MVFEEPSACLDGVCLLLLDMERGPSAVAISSVFTAFAGLFVAMRLVCRLGIRRTAGSDDGLTSVAIACSIVLTALIAARKYRCSITRILANGGLEEKYGLGQHFSSLREGEFPKMMKVGLVYSTFHYLANNSSCSGPAYSCTA